MACRAESWHSAMVNFWWPLVKQMTILSAIFFHLIVLFPARATFFFTKSSDEGWLALVTPVRNLSPLAALPAVWSCSRLHLRTQRRVFLARKYLMLFRLLYILHIMGQFYKAHLRSRHCMQYVHHTKTWLRVGQWLPWAIKTKYKFILFERFRVL